VFSVPSDSFLGAGFKYSYLLTSPSMEHKHGTVCQPILEHQIRLCAPSSVISRPTCVSSSPRCYWLVA